MRADIHDGQEQNRSIQGPDTEAQDQPSPFDTSGLQHTAGPYKWVKTDMGGPSATLTPQESVTALRRLIETFGANNSGKFYHYDGSEYPW